jgi:hypothetical protein
MKEILEPGVFHDLSILPAQFFSRRWCDKRMEPFRRLALAVLVDAVHVFQTNAEASHHSRRREFNEAREWLFGPPGHGPFDFENVCFLLDVDPLQLRRWLARWRAMKRAGTPCRVVRRRPPLRHSAALAASGTRRRSGALEVSHARAQG